VDTRPEPVGSRSLGAGEFFYGLASGLYSPLEWSFLQQALGKAKNGDGSDVLRLADDLSGRNPDGTYNNLVESNTAINCVDRPNPTSIAAYDADAKSFAKDAPHFGAAIAYGSMACAFWHVPAVESAHPVSAPGAPPIVVIGTTRDPATPYVWAQSLARQLSSGVLVTFDGDGHTAYGRGNSCILRVANGYLNDLTVPARGTRCG
jgi:hypothetical protein